MDLKKTRNIVLALLALSILSTVSIAAIIYTKQIAGHVSVEIPPSPPPAKYYEITIYESDGITVCSEIQFGVLRRGESSVHDIVVKNTGDYNFVNISLDHTLLSTVGTISWNLTGTNPLNVRATIPVRLTLTINEDASAETTDFIIKIQGET